MSCHQVTLVTRKLRWLRCHLWNGAQAYLTNLSPHLLQLSGTLTIPCWQWFLIRFGKKMAVYFGITVSCFVNAAAAHCPVLLIVRQQEPSFSPVGRTLHDSNRLRQEQPDNFLLGVCGCRCERGSGIPPAVVSSPTERWRHTVNLHWWNSLRCFVVFQSKILALQVNASRCRGWLQG